VIGVRETHTGDPHEDVDFDFAVMVGGFKTDAAEPDHLFTHPLRVPSVHVIGRTDGVVPPLPRFQSMLWSDHVENGVRQREIENLSRW
jgi:hypothetical protein